MVSVRGEKGEKMPRLIDADRLRKDVLDLSNCPNGYSDTYDKAIIIDLIDEQPIVDTVPMVRHKDCKWGIPQSENDEYTGSFKFVVIAYAIAILFMAELIAGIMFY